MSKTINLYCDVKPCHYPATREIEVNGETVHLCGESCFLKFWGREYDQWIKDRYNTQVTFSGARLIKLERISKLG